MAKVINGIMRFTIDGKEIFHEVEASISGSMEVKKVASKDGITKSLGDEDWSASVSALGAVDATKADTLVLMTAYKSKAVVPLTFTTGESGDITFTGDVFITAFSAKKPKGDALAMDYTLESTTGEIGVAAVV